MHHHRNYQNKMVFSDLVIKINKIGKDKMKLTAARWVHLRVQALLEKGTNPAALLARAATGLARAPDSLR